MRFQQFEKINLIYIIYSRNFAGIRGNFCPSAWGKSFQTDVKEKWKIRTLNVLVNEPFFLLDVGKMLNYNTSQFSNR